MIFSALVYSNFFWRSKKDKTSRKNALQAEPQKCHNRLGPQSEKNIRQELQVIIETVLQIQSLKVGASVLLSWPLKASRQGFAIDRV